MDRNGLVSLLGSSVEQLTLAINKVHMMASYHEQNIFLIVATIPCCDLFCLRESLQGVWFASRLALFSLCLHVEFLLILLWVNSPWHSKLAICFPFGHETTEVVSPGCQCLDYSFFQTWRKNVSTTVLQSKVRTKGCTTMGDQIS